MCYKFSRWAHYGVCFDTLLSIKDLCWSWHICATISWSCFLVLLGNQILSCFFFFLSLTLILGLSIKTYIPVVWALEQFWDLVKYFLSKANPFRNINRAIIRRVFRIGGTSQSVSKASKGHKKPLNTWRCLRNVSSFSTLQEF